MATHRAGSSRRTRLRLGPAGAPVAVLLAISLALTGLVLVVVGLRGQQSAPRPPRSLGVIAPPESRAARIPTAGSRSDDESRSTTGSGPSPLVRSLPVRIRVPAVGVDSTVNPIGLAADGSLGVPRPGPGLDEAAWFRNSPTPGQSGPAIIEGHVDSTQGPSVFFRLGDVRPGDRIEIDRADGRRLTFTVDAVRDYDKAAFPTRTVYGGDLTRPQLRLITCSDFDAALGHHVGNEVVFSHLTDVSRERAS